MPSNQGFYALIQFSPAPERFEFVNIGVALFVPERNYVGIRFSHSLKRVERLFGKQPKSYFDVLKASFKNRLESDFSQGIDMRRFEAFAKTRANQMRIANVLSIVTDNPEADLGELFSSLVGEDGAPSRLPRIESELRKKFQRAGVDKFVESKPRPVALPQGVTIQAPYGYQNGAYNLIDPVRLGGIPGDALGEASKRAVEGQWLRHYSRAQGAPKELIVVGDFADQKQEFKRAIAEVMAEKNVSFFDINRLEPLLDDIKRHAEGKSRSVD